MVEYAVKCLEAIFRIETFDGFRNSDGKVLIS